MLVLEILELMERALVVLALVVVMVLHKALALVVVALDT
jgi:hypothetical protein